MKSQDKNGPPPLGGSERALTGEKASSEIDTSTPDTGAEPVSRKYAALFSSISTSVRLADLPDHATRLFYTWLLPHCDAWGRSTASPRVLNARVWPLVGETPEHVEAILGHLEAAGLVEVHKDTGGDWLQVPDWEEKSGALGRIDRRGPPEWGPPGVVPEGSGSGPARGRGRASPLLSSSLSESTEETKTKTRARGKPTTVQAELVEWWCACWKHYRETDYSPQTKDFVIAAKLLKLASVDEIRSRACNLLESEDKFYIKAADLPLLHSQWNKLAGRIEA